MIRLLTAVVLLALAGAAIGMPGVGTGRSPRPVLAKATAPLAHSNSGDGHAILTAANLKPGERRTGEVTITNRGDRGALYLVAHRPHDRAAALSERLQMTVADGKRVLDAGPLAGAPGCRPLGEFGAGESRTYRFTVEFPERGGSDNSYAGASTTVDYEWVGTDRDACVPAPEVDASLADMKLAIMRGPYEFAGRAGTARIGIRCVRSSTGTCAGRLELERRTTGQGRGIAMAVGKFRVESGTRRRVTLKLNPRARRRITSKRLIAVRAYVVARDAQGRRHRAAYRDHLQFRAR